MHAGEGGERLACRFDLIADAAPKPTRRTPRPRLARSHARGHRRRMITSCTRSLAHPPQHTQASYSRPLPAYCRLDGRPDPSPLGAALAVASLAAGFSETPRQHAHQTVTPRINPAWPPPDPASSSRPPIQYQDHARPRTPHPWRVPWPLALHDPGATLALPWRAFGDDDLLT